MKILITGVAGFIGAELARSVLHQGVDVMGIDNFNDYYEVSLKRDRVARLEQLEGGGAFTLVDGDICDQAVFFDLFDRHSFGAVVHLAAQAGVRYSLENPSAYVESNLVGFSNE